MLRNDVYHGALGLGSQRLSEIWKSSKNKEVTSILMKTLFKGGLNRYIVLFSWNNYSIQFFSYFVITLTYHIH